MGEKKDDPAFTFARYVEEAIREIANEEALRAIAGKGPKPVVDSEGEK